MPGALPFAVGSLFAALWVLTSFMEYASVAFEAKVFWFKVQVALQLPAITAITCFALEYTWPGRWLTRRNLILLSIVPTVALALIITNDFHQLLWRGFAYDGTVVAARSSYIWPFILYAMLLGIIELAAFGWLFWYSPPQRWPVALMMSAQIVTRAVYLLSGTAIFQDKIPLDVILIAYLFVSYAFALFAFRLLDPIPMASQTVIEQLQDGMLLLDPVGRIVKLNASARTILGIPTHSKLGQRVQELLPDYSTDWAGPTEISLKSGSLPGDYVLVNSVLVDWRGSELGYLVVLREVTEERRAQAKIVEQQRALAMLHEREHLARELHDSTGQVLGYASFQVEAIATLNRDGRIELANSQLDRLGGILRAAHADVRAQILDLRTAPDGQKPFFTALNDYLEGYATNYGIQTELSVDETISKEPFPPDDQMQIFRIVQEALTNTRRHSQARHVSVAFVRDNSLLRLIIEDDGIGFDVGQPPATGEGHFGLRFMRERAEVLGGCLWIDAAPATGTRMMLELPVKEG